MTMVWQAFQARDSSSAHAPRAAGARGRFPGACFLCAGLSRHGLRFTGKGFHAPAYGGRRPCSPLKAGRRMKRDARSGGVPWGKMFSFPPSWRTGEQRLRRGSVLPQQMCIRDRNWADFRIYQPIFASSTLETAKRKNTDIVSISEFFGGGSGGIRTHVPSRTTAFRGALNG